MEIAAFIEEYAALSKKEKDLVRILYDAEIKFRKGIYQHVRRKQETLAAYAKCCTKTVSRFNQVVKYLLIGVILRKSKGKQQATEYRFDPEFFKAMQLLDSKNLLYKDSKKLLEFADFHRGKENVHRLSEKCPSSLSDSSFSDMSLYGFVHPYLEKIQGIAHKDKLFMSRRYPEHAIVSGVEDAIWWWKQGNRPDTSLTAVVHARIKERANL